MNNKINERKERINKLWKKAHDVLNSVYGEMPDVRMLNRFYSEMMIFGKSDSIIFWDLVAKIRDRARERGYTTSIGGTDGSCFTAYLLGLCENPLPLHYYCPMCKRVEFINERALPWDLPDKACSCGELMRADGFDIPYEIHIASAHKPWPNIWVDPRFIGEVGEFVRELMGDVYRICTLTKPDLTAAKFVFLPYDGEPDFEESIEAAEGRYNDYPHVTIIPLDMYERASKLSEETGVDFSKINPANPRVIAELADGNIENIPNFTSKSRDMREDLHLAAPRSSYDLLQFLGAMHGTNTWRNNAECLIRDGICSMGEISTHRDDVFLLLRDKLREAGHEDAGIAYNLAMKIRYGSFARNGMDAESRALLEYLDLPEWFIPYAEKIQYMFPKAHNVESLRTSLTFMWYKINYPEAFNKVMMDFEGEYE